MASKPTHNRRGMTLLELVLALALSALLLMAISMALEIHWKAIDVRRSRVEEAQLATAILRRVSDDIRSTLKFEPPDLSGLNLASAIPENAEELLESATGGEGGEGDSGGTSGDSASGNGGSENQQGSPMQPMQGGSQTTPSSGQGSPAPSSGDSSGTTGGDTGGSSGEPQGGSSGTDQQSASGDDAAAAAEPGSDPAAEAGPSVVVGLYGSATELQFDISRLPRVDQYQSPMLSPVGAPAELPSDIKTVVYFLNSDEAAGDAGGVLPLAGSVQPSLTGMGRGLMRAESERAASAYGAMNGATDTLYGGAALLAAEVTSLQFQYYDGVEWLPEWNSDEQQGLPLAIEVLFTLDTTGDSPAAAPSAALVADPLASPDQKVFRMVVQLPVGGKFATAAASETGEAEAMDGTETGAGADPAAADGGTLP